MNIALIYSQLDTNLTKRGHKKYRLAQLNFIQWSLLRKKMKRYNNLKSALILTMLATLSACGSAPLIKTNIQTEDLDEYDNMLISDVRVYSNETEAEYNVELTEKLEGWKFYSKALLETYISNSKYNLVTSLGDAEGSTLLVDLDVNVLYGNRALRWAVGYGAGEGGVDSTLTVTDAVTEEVKYKSQADSNLTMGVAGGDVGDMLEENVQNLIQQYIGN
tara:strand:- start:921 stop:1577 length:657 start_codon:yes stop_codon:yes gene_type:complete